MKLKSTIKKIIPKKQVKVNLFIVGAQKAGTSALHNYLCKHPNIIGGKKKEINFFNHKEKFNAGEHWYHQQFPQPFFWQSNKILLDSTPQYLSENGIAQKIYDYNPNATIIILLRNPVERAYSAWNMYKQFSELSEHEKFKLIDRHVNEEQKKDFLNLINTTPFYTFDEYVSHEINNNKLKDFFPYIIKRGIYVDQVKSYIELFGYDNLLVFESNFFKNNKLEVTNNVLNSINLESRAVKSDELKSFHSRKYESPINPKTKEKLEEFYKPYNEKLFKLIGQRFNW